MYIIGALVYALESYLICTIKNKMYGDILKRALSALIGFTLYLLVALIPSSWIEWIKIEYVSQLFYIFVAGAVTGIFNFISGRLVKVSYEKMNDHVIFSCFFCISAILCFA